MTISELNQVPVLVENAVITKTEGLHQTAEFISREYPVFGLHLYDEDFRSEIMVRFLERGVIIFDIYKKELGDYYSFLYSYLYNLVSAEKKFTAKKILRDSVTDSEYKKVFQYESEDHEALIPMELREPPLSYSREPLSQNQLKSIFKEMNISKENRAILALAIKAGYYLDDRMIHRISKYLEIDENLLIKTIELINNALDEKIKKHKRLESYRDKAYIYHKSYETQMERIKADIKYDCSTETKYRSMAKLERLNRINKKQISNWEKLTYKFQNGYSTIKPSNQSIANVIGICERQVSYYIFCAKNGKMNINEIKEKVSRKDKD